MSKSNEITNDDLEKYYELVDGQLIPLTKESYQQMLDGKKPFSIYMCGLDRSE